MLPQIVALALYPLVVLAIHRIYNRERVFDELRSKLRLVPIINCEACNLFWIALGAACALPVATNPWVAPLWLALAAYGPVRAAMWCYDLDVRILNLIGGKVAPKPADPGGCKTCASKKKLKEQGQNAMKLPRRAAFILDHIASPEGVLPVLEQVHTLANSPHWFVKVLTPSNPGTLPILKVIRGWGLPEDKLAISPLPSEGSDNLEKAAFEHILIIGNGIIVASGAFQADGWGKVLTRLGSLRGFKLVVRPGVKLPEGLSPTLLKPADDILKTLDTLWPEAVRSREA
jgi:hypothetical protein